MRWSARIGVVGLAALQQSSKSSVLVEVSKIRGIQSGFHTRMSGLTKGTRHGNR
jgi:hypothetical protein